MPNDGKVWIQLRGGGGWGCACMAATLPLIEDEMLRLGLIKRSLDVFQWAYNPARVRASAGTHDLGGVIDVGQFSLPQRKVWARYGVMMFPRTRQFGWYTGNHGHGVWHGCPHQVPYTDWQVRSGLYGGDGLGSSATLKGKRMRYFEAPKRTWQDAVRVETAAAKGAKTAAAAEKRTVAPVKRTGVQAMGLDAAGKARPISFSVYDRAARKGLASGNVKIVQKLLQAQGYYKGPLDGRYGAVTKRAVYAWQKAIGDKPDGWLGPRQFTKLVQWGGWRYAR